MQSNFHTASALWTTGPGRAELRPSELGVLSEGSLRVRAVVSGISRGTERLVHEGRVPRSEWERMRCPFQEGAFPWPVKYGYAMVGLVEAGPEALAGRRVFGLHPHQSRFDLLVAAAIPIPDGIPSDRAVLAPQVETALNAIWDAGDVGGRIAVVGGGVIGLLTAWLAARTAEVIVLDRNPAREEIARHLGLAFASPESAVGDCDLVFHASGTCEGLNLALDLCRFEGRVIELSWFGDAAVGVMLGGAFHSRRLTLQASQVGSIAPSRRGVYDHRKRLERMGSILADPDTLCHLIRYPE